MLTNKPKVVVIGSINMDMVTRSSRFPQKGETISGESFDQLPGGKGANQAVAAARLGAEVSMIGAVGDDHSGQALLKHLQDEQIDTSFVQILQGQTTGMAQITVSEEDNQIIIVPGANFALTKEHIDAAKDIIQSADIVVLQLEIPLEIVEHAAQIAAESAVKVILNPAPAPAERLNESLLQAVHYITPNETELAHMTEQSNVELGIEDLLKEKVDAVVVTLGSEGVRFKQKGDIVTGFVQGRDVEVIDTTGAGDTFNGALSYCLASGIELAEAIEFANDAAGLSVTKFGAQTGMPTLTEVRKF
ncbi:ribokinase [Alkalicoccobacillus plakortidis]|uniref:Ribokinase n=1 Tax=Alkalicoccobacillus plakortidis TaxID=444060 RepID=A0ABT0XIQ9_9BACI|nr:ribokinase [Alkalicoccobacillus plakortidis]MCM2675776.1 ribokinase [Alkalicoccobacillus plakortidis]